MELGLTDGIQTTQPTLKESEEERSRPIGEDPDLISRQGFKSRKIIKNLISVIICLGQHVRL